MNEQTRRLRGEFDEIVRRGRELVSASGDDALRRRPKENAWSAGECIEHLSVVAEKYVRRFQRAIDAAPDRPPRGDEKLTLIGRMLVAFNEPPVKVRLPAPKSILPPAAIAPLPELLTRFETSHAELMRVWEESEAFDRSALRIATPASRHFTITIIDACALLAAHARRHLWQAERALR